MTTLVRTDNMVLEFIEVSIHQLLYLNNIYPSGIFSRAQKYNTPVQVSVHPLVNNYIELCLKTAQDLIHQNMLSNVTLMFCCDEKPVRKIVFDISSLHKELQLKSLEYTLLETGLRDSLLKISISDRHLTPLPKGSTYKILLGTKEQGHVAMSTDPVFTNNQDFPWVRSEKQQSRELSVGKPLCSLDMSKISFQVYMMEDENLRSFSPNDSTFLLHTPL